jgi:hypothetical protein
MHKTLFGKIKIFALNISILKFSNLKKIRTEAYELTHRIKLVLKIYNKFSEIKIIF